MDTYREILVVFSSFSSFDATLHILRRYALHFSLRLHSLALAEFSVDCCFFSWIILPPFLSAWPHSPFPLRDDPFCPAAFSLWSLGSGRQWITNNLTYTTQHNTTIKRHHGGWWYLFLFLLAKKILVLRVTLFLVVRASSLYSTLAIKKPKKSRPTSLHFMVCIFLTDNAKVSFLIQTRRTAMPCFPNLHGLFPRFFFLGREPLLSARRRISLKANRLIPLFIWKKNIRIKNLRKHNSTVVYLWEKKIDYTQLVLVNSNSMSHCLNIFYI